MKLAFLAEMGASAVCPKCGRGPMSKTHHWYKGEWKCKAGAEAAFQAQQAAGGSLPTSPATIAPVTPLAPAVSPVPRAPRPQPTAQSLPNATLRKMLETALTKLKISNYTIAPDLSVSVAGDVRVSMSRYQKIPFKFSEVTGDFTWIGGELATMENMPDEVGGSFVVSNNHITGLAGIPGKIGGAIDVSDNEIKSMVGLPSVTLGDLDLDGNSASDMVEHLPSEIKGSLTIGSRVSWSIRGIHKKTRLDGTIYVRGELEEGGLGLLMLKGLTGIDVYNDNDTSKTNPKKAFELIEKARAEARDVLDVQDELIDAGYARYAKL